MEAKAKSGTLRIFEAAYRSLVLKKRRDVSFWVLLSFLPTFIFVRIIVYLFSPYVYLYIYGTHIHHFAWGIILLAVAGFAALFINKPKWKPFVASLYGVGLALA
ncbi:MAG: hypothetical protein PHH26_04575, partial [Candidatus Thermoplasmatota archaeon]|nr:hypothetical protein [Candidatus Thermoplasmatota archaeon]